jgi:hypothetical protein
MDSAEKPVSAPILDSIEGEFKAQAQNDRKQRIEILAPIARQGTEPLAIHEGSLFMIGVAYVVGVLMLIAGISNAKSALGMCLFALLPLGFATFLLLRSKKPIMSLEKDGLVIGTSQKGLIPWTAIDDYRVNVHSTNGVTTAVVLGIDLLQGFVSPKFSGGRRMKYLKKKHQISVHMLGLRGISTDKFAESVGDYWQAGLARAELAGYDTAS